MAAETFVDYMYIYNIRSQGFEHDLGMLHLILQNLHDSWIDLATHCELNLYAY